jgi:hypothetical protein
MARSPTHRAATGQEQLPSPDRRTRTVVAVIAVALAVAGLMVIVGLRGPDREQAAIRELPPQERRVLYEQTLHTLTSTCASARRSTGLDDFCRRQAKFVVKFSECDAACASVANKFRDVPTR